MDGLDLLGAGDAWADQFITIRIKDINVAKLKEKIGGSKGQIASSAISMVDSAPKAVLDLVLPVVKSTAKDYGINADISVAKAAFGKPRAFSEFWPGLLLGFGLGGFGLLMYKGVQALVKR